MKDENILNALVVLSSSDDVEFQGFEGIVMKMDQLFTDLDTASERKDLHDNECRKVVDAYNETLSIQENKKKNFHQQFAECQAEISETEKHLEISNTQLKLVMDEVDEKMKKKEKLMISSENDEAEDLLEAAIFEAKFTDTAFSIRWPEAKAPHKITGCLIESYGPKDFDFDKREKSGFYICNKLWEMMEPEQDWSDLFVKPTKYHGDKDVVLSFSLDNDQLDESVACSSTNPHLLSVVGVI